VQVKSQAGVSSFDEYRESVEGRSDCRKFYFAVHSPSPELSQLEPAGAVELLRPAEIAELVVRYGLVDWIIGKAG